MRHRSDENQKPIVAALRSVGVLVWCVGEPCDLLCRHRDRYFLLDVDGVTLYRKRDIKQLANFKAWGVTLVKTPEAALKAVGL